MARESMVAADGSGLRVSDAGDGMVSFGVRAKPNARQSAVVGVKEGALEVRLAARPVDGAANEELVTLLAEALDVSRRDVRVARGASSRMKRVEIGGLSLDEVRRRLSAK